MIKVITGICRCGKSFLLFVLYKNHLQALDYIRKGQGGYRNMAAYPFENIRINANIKTGELFQIYGMQDYYLSVTFRYTGKTWNGCVPIKSKYQGTDIPLTLDDVKDWVLSCYTELDPGRNQLWQNSQRQFWETGRRMTHRRYLMLSTDKTH